jgi:hypothetical protein
MSPRGTSPFSGVGGFRGGRTGVLGDAGEERPGPDRHVVHDRSGHVCGGLHGLLLLQPAVRQRVPSGTRHGLRSGRRPVRRRVDQPVLVSSAGSRWYRCSRRSAWTRSPDIVGWLLLGALVVGYGQLASAPYRTGYASVRLGLMLPLFAGLAAAAYAIIIAVLVPGLRSPAATLNMTIVAFLIGVPAYAAHTILPIAAHRGNLAPFLATRWHLAVITYAEGTTVLIGFCSCRSSDWRKNLTGRAPPGARTHAVG